MSDATLHTRGPWMIGDVSKGESPLMIYCDDSLGSRVADCSRSGHGITTAQDRANARLISAAPELLTALRNLLTECQRHGSFDHVSFEFPTVKPVFDAARAAVAKAQGRSPGPRTVVYTDGTYIEVNGPTWEYESDPDWVATI